MERLLSLKEACIWATEFTGKKVTESNISYLLQYGKIKKYTMNGKVFVSLDELEHYYTELKTKRKIEWIEKLGENINWHLSFENYKEAETTKHVHRLHPYKGKFIPQLVAYFLDEHTDEFKKEVYFRKGDIVLDPFCGSGTTLVQANELGIHAIGVDISEFNALISNVKVKKYNLLELKKEIDRITKKLLTFNFYSKYFEFDRELSTILNEFNKEYFSLTEYKYKIKTGEINEKLYGKEKERDFLEIYNKILDKYGIHVKQEESGNFLDVWYTQPIREEIKIVLEEIKKIEKEDVRNILTIILSRTARSCRSTSHSDLATLKDPVKEPYYCPKHLKICKPLFSMVKWWKTYSKDTLKRLIEFDKLRTETYQICLVGDSRDIDIIKEIETKNREFSELVKTKKIKGIFSSPPYVGLIDYHQQHAYAYELFNIERRDDKEIGPLFRGQGKEAREAYIEGISQVLLNCKKYLADDYNVFLVVNDKYNLYPVIIEKANMRIVNQYKRPVLNRSEKDKNAYSESILHLKEK